MDLKQCFFFHKNGDLISNKYITILFHYPIYVFIFNWQNLPDY